MTSSNNTNVTYAQLKTMLEGSSSLEEDMLIVKSESLRISIFECFADAIKHRDKYLVGLLARTFRDFRYNVILNPSKETGKYDLSEIEFMCEVYEELFHKSPEGLKNSIPLVLHTASLTPETFDQLTSLAYNVHISELDCDFDANDAFEAREKLVNSLLSSSSTTLTSITWYPGDGSYGEVSKDVELICRLIKGCPKLTYLIVYDYNLRDEHKSALYRAVTEHPTTWQYVDICGGDYFTVADDSVPDLINLIRRDNVVSLDVTSRTYEWTDDLLEAIGCTTKLEDIQLREDDPDETYGDWVRIDEDKFPGYVTSRRLLGRDYMNLAGEIIKNKR